MTAQANVTIKKNDGTTDITYTAALAAAGDGASAQYRSLTVGSASAHQPELRIAAKEARQGKARAFRVTYKYPQIATDTTTGLVSVVDAVQISEDFILPKGMPAVDVNEAIAQFANLMASAHLKAVVQSMYGPT